MANPETPGRMLRRSISRSKKLAELSPKELSLYFMIIPYLNSHGKMNGDPYYIKGEVCPRIPWLTIKDVTECLEVISAKTNMKWFYHDGLHYIHCVNFFKHQKLEKIGKDKLPSYEESTTSRQQVDDKSTTSRFLVDLQDKDRSISKKKKHICSKPGCNDDDPRFVCFWEKYPRKAGKVDARKAWKQLNPGDDLVKSIMSGLESLLETDFKRYLESGTPQYIILPAGFLRRRRWEDEPTVPRNLPSQGGAWEKYVGESDKSDIIDL